MLQHADFGASIAAHRQHFASRRRSSAFAEAAARQVDRRYKFEPDWHNASTQGGGYRTNTHA